MWEDSPAIHSHDCPVTTQQRSNYCLWQEVHIINAHVFKLKHMPTCQSNGHAYCTSGIVADLAGISTFVNCRPHIHSPADWAEWGQIDWKTLSLVVSAVTSNSWSVSNKSFKSTWIWRVGMKTRMNGMLRCVQTNFSELQLNVSS